MLALGLIINQLSFMKKSIGAEANVVQNCYFHKKNLAAEKKFSWIFSLPHKLGKNHQAHQYRGYSFLFETYRRTDEKISKLA